MIEVQEQANRAAAHFSQILAVKRSEEAAEKEARRRARAAREEAAAAAAIAEGELLAGPSRPASERAEAFAEARRQMTVVCTSNLTLFQSVYRADT